MILMVTPKGWTGPKMIDGLQYEGTWRSHQVPLTETRTNADHRQMLPGLDASPTGPRSCSTPSGRVVDRIAALAPVGDRRMSANPHANGGLLLKAAAAARLPRTRRRR